MFCEYECYTGCRYGLTLYKASAFQRGPGIDVRSSPDRVNWTFHGNMWPDGTTWADPYNDGPNGYVSHSLCTE